MSSASSVLTVGRPWPDLPVVSVGWPSSAVRNALSGSTAEALTQVLAGLDPEVRVVVLGHDQKPFCSGWDIHDLAAVDVESDEAVAAFFRPGRRLLSALEQLPVIVVSVVRGAALGFGCSVLAHSDLVLASDDATFGLPEIRRGFPASTVIPELLGCLSPREVRAWALTGSKMDAERARRAGLVHESLPEALLDGRVESLVAELAGVERLAVGDTKALLSEAVGLPASARREAGVAMATRYLRGAAAPQTATR